MTMTITNSNLFIILAMNDLTDVVKLSKLILRKSDIIEIGIQNDEYMFIRLSNGQRHDFQYSYFDNQYEFTSNDSVVTYIMDLINL